MLDAIINGKVVESTASFIGNYVRMYIPYAEVVGRTIVPDDREAIRNAVMKALDMADIVITTGGTGPSGIDYVYEVTKSLNPRIYIRGGLRMSLADQRGGLQYWVVIRSSLTCRVIQYRP